MILTREIIVKINESNLSYYEELGYDVTIGEALIIPIELLSTGSHYKIDCKCDTCGKIKEVIFKNYVKYDNRWGEYFCRKCSESKRKKTLKENYGVGLLKALNQRFSGISFKANCEIYARFQYRRNGFWTPLTRLERYCVAAWVGLFPNA